MTTLTQQLTDLETRVATLAATVGALQASSAATATLANQIAGRVGDLGPNPPTVSFVTRTPEPVAQPAPDAAPGPVYPALVQS